MAAPIYKLIYNPNSPYVHKVLVAAREIGVRDKIGLEQVTVVPFDAVPNAIATKGNPLAKVPTLVLDHASPTPKHIIDSSVIVQFLNAISDPDKKVLPPIDDLKRYDALTLEAIADGTLDATLLLRYEGVRPESEQSADWKNGQLGKMKRGYARLASLTLPGKDYEGPLPLPSIARFCVLWYADRRIPNLGWREWDGVKGTGLAEWFEELKERPSFKAEEVPV